MPKDNQADNQADNPYAPPLSPARPPTAELAEPDEINDMLQRAFFAATYGTLFFPGLGYLISLFVLKKARERQREFSPAHEKLYRTTVTICWILLLPMLAALVAFAIAADFEL